jgi:1-acyl-sn-glycerol-3-phosphate acyltransferase
MRLPLREVVRELRELARPLPADPLARRDPDFIRRHLPIVERLVEAWFAPEYEGLEHIPAGRALVVGTHNGGFISPDLFSFMVGLWRVRGTEPPIYGLAHDVVFRLPLMATWLSKLGAVPARRELALELLGRDLGVVVYPGGVREAYKRHAARNTVDFYGRTGFVRTAIRGRAPIVPLVSAGAHDAIYVLSDGVPVARALGLDARLRIDTLPLQLCLPWGVAIGPVPYLPAPCKVKLAVLPPIELGLPPEAADDPGAVADAYRRVVGVMQAGLDALVARGGAGLRGRLRA